MYIKKKLMTISVILAMTASFAACSDNGSSNSGKSGNNNVPEAQGTLSSEEFEELTKHSLSIEPFIPDSEVEQDAVEVDNNANSNINNIPGGNANNIPGGNANNNNSDNSNAANPNQPNSVTGNDVGNNNVDIPDDTGLKVISGTKTLMQAYWMDLSQYKDHVFNGEYLTAEFKIKEDAVDGIYPITIDWVDFSNWDAVDLDFTSIDGAIVVGKEVKENTFNNDDTPQIMVQNVSGKQGDTVTVTFNIKNNPGAVASLLRFGYNSDALEYYGGGEGADFNGKFQN